MLSDYFSRANSLKKTGKCLVQYFRCKDNKGAGNNHNTSCAVRNCLQATGIVKTQLDGGFLEGSAVIRLNSKQTEKKNIRHFVIINVIFKRKSFVV